MRQLLLVLPAQLVLRDGPHHSPGTGPVLAAGELVLVPTVMVLALIRTRPTAPPPAPV